VAQQQPGDYTAKDIKALEGIEHVRMRPGMYVGGTDIHALHHLVYEVVDNSVDEALAGYCNHIQIVIQSDGGVAVNDNGRGIPVDTHEERGISALELVMTKIGAGGKFGSKAYGVTGGLHGVGVSAVNALSNRLIAQVRRDGQVYEQIYERGQAVTPVQMIRPMKDYETSGTQVVFYPDGSIMQETTFNYQTLLQRFREIAFVTSQITISLRDERVEPFPHEINFFFEGGLRSFVYYLNRNRDPLCDIVYTYKEIPFEDPDPEKSYKVGVEVAFQYADTTTVTELAFANTINTPDGGQHQSGLRTAITRTINNYARKVGLLKEKDANFSGNDTLEGLTAIVSIKHPNPQFESQTKVKLMNPEVQGAVSSVVGEAFTEYLETHSREARRIVEKCMTSMRARDAAKKASELVRRGSNLLENTTLPGKLADCSDRNPQNTELFIVEGDSAGGCFSGDTQIALADGRHLSFLELMAEQAEGREHFAYTIRHDGTIGLERIINVRLTKKQAEVIRVTLDNGETITCTPDHRFMLRDGSYKPAAELSPDDSLMPLYRQGQGMLEMVLDPHTSTWLFVHDLYEGALAGQLIWENDGEAIPYNHRIRQIDPLSDRMDVYDLEVPHTHNFALASGVFVHNSAKQGRDRHFQAILPLRGKILNTERANLNKILDNNEVRALISALGTGIREDFNLAKLRYNRIILMADADVDGAHIRTLLLTFFFRYMRPIIEDNHLYIAQPPIYSIKEGKTMRYYYGLAGETDADTLARGLRDFKDPGRVHVQRYKGLGEMNPEQLWETTLNPTIRQLLLVTIDDAAEADRTFDMLMGNAVPPRRKFIQTHARSVRNLDV
jgi:DNA gyrase subunit B